MYGWARIPRGHCSATCQGSHLPWVPSHAGLSTSGPLQEMAPMDLVELLNAIFTALDGVVEACAGVPEEAGVHKGAGWAGPRGGPEAA